jgi:hypothetical protein
MEWVSGSAKWQRDRALPLTVGMASARRIEIAGGFSAAWASAANLF